MSYSNPFHEVFETKRYRHARTLRSSFLQKMRDSYYVMAGSYFDADRKNHVGMFDYITLNIPTMSAKLLNWCSNNIGGSRLAVILIIPSAIVALPLNAIRYVMAASITLLSTPIIAITHLFSKVISNKYKERIRNIRVIPSYDNKQCAETSLGECLDKKNINMDKLDIDALGTYAKFSLSVKQGETGGSSGLFCNCCAEGKHADASVISMTPSANVVDKKNFKALLKLNVGEITTKLEKGRYKLNRFFSNSNENDPEINGRILDTNLTNLSR